MLGVGVGLGFGALRSDLIAVSAQEFTEGECGLVRDEADMAEDSREYRVYQLLSLLALADVTRQRCGHCHTAMDWAKNDVEVHANIFHSLFCRVTDS